MAKLKRKGYTILLILTAALVLAAISTVIPQSSADEPCKLGYNAHCSFTPISTLLCLALAGIVCKIRRRFFTQSK
ncbi:MAG: hypothetical protein ACYS80_10090 [Planctomycetota bacterium]|jgi:hypothetical protein